MAPYAATGSRPSVVAADVIRFEEEVIADAVREIALERLAAYVGFLAR